MSPLTRLDRERKHGRQLADAASVSIPEMDAVRAQVAAVKVGPAVGDPAVSVAIFSESLGLGHYDAWSPEVIAAFDHLELSEKYGTGMSAGLYSLRHPFDPPSSESVEGLANSVKGTMLEQEVVEQIAAQKLPGIPEQATSGVMAEKLNQPGWDVDVLGPDGSHIEFLQVKAGSLATVREHLERYPQIDHVAVTHDVAVEAANAGVGDHIIDTGVDGHALANDVSDTMDNVTLAHGIHEFVPEFALLTIAAMVVYRCGRGEPLEDALGWGKERAIDAGLANGAALLVVMVCGDPLILRPAVAMSVRFARMRHRRANQAGVRFAKLSASLIAIREDAEHLRNAVKADVLVPSPRRAERTVHEAQG
mgnify:CR=1 FL=1